MRFNYVIFVKVSRKINIFMFVSLPVYPANEVCRSLKLFVFIVIKPKRDVDWPIYFCGGHRLVRNSSKPVLTGKYRHAVG